MEDLNHPVTGLAVEDVQAIYTERLGRRPLGTPCAQQLAVNQTTEVSRNCESSISYDHFLDQTVITLETINLKASLKILNRT